VETVKHFFENNCYMHLMYHVMVLHKCINTFSARYLPVFQK